MNYSEDAYHSYGTKWLKFLTFFYFPISAIQSLFWLITSDYSSMSFMSRCVIVCYYFFYFLIYSLASWHLYKRTIAGYYLSFVSLFSEGLSLVFLILLMFTSSILEKGDIYSAIMCFVVGIANYLYVKRRRVLFGSPNVGPLSFSLSGQRIISLALLVVFLLNSAYSIAYVCEMEFSAQSYDKLESDYNSLSAELEGTKASLEVAQSQVDLYLWLSNEREKYETFMTDCVRFVTEHGEKYHLYECSVIENADNIYYFFVDDLETLDYEPCSLCNPSP